MTNDVLRGSDSANDDTKSDDEDGKVFAKSISSTKCDHAQDHVGH
jgi:hypothetical protein